jgi:2-dehydro-3-deoxyphosphogluconate aldolase/(4S)-4-hydroxy-2-oxoglutarate aldolase
MRGALFNRFKRTIGMSAKTDKLLSILKLQPVVPVLVIDDAASAVPLARALVHRGEPQ